MGWRHANRQAWALTCIAVMCPNPPQWVLSGVDCTASDARAGGELCHRLRSREPAANLPIQGVQMGPACDPEVQSPCNPTCKREPQPVTAARPHGAHDGAYSSDSRCRCHLPCSRAFLPCPGFQELTFPGAVAVPGSRRWPRRTTGARFWGPSHVAQQLLDSPFRCHAVHCLVMLQAAQQMLNHLGYGWSIQAA